MLIKLVKYELNKKWKALKYILFAYILVQTVLLILTRTVFWNSSIPKIFLSTDNDVSMAFALALALYFVLVFIMGIIPFIESVYRFEKDLVGKQAVLELMLPITSWKKIISKLIATLCSSAVCVVWVIFSILVFILVNVNFDKVVVEAILNAIRSIGQDPLKSIFIFLILVCSFVTFYMIILLCSAISKTFSHKNKISGPIGAAAFALCLTVLILLNMLVEKFPIYQFNVLGISGSISSIIVNSIIFSVALFCTSWLMEKKIEN